eukprot:5979181-Prorocentrum_lima.AAC.1
MEAERLRYQRVLAHCRTRLAEMRSERDDLQRRLDEVRCERGLLVEAAAALEADIFEERGRRLALERRLQATE